jgi:glucokinase
LVITLGTGLGSGIYVDNKLLYGFTGFAGELGHTTAIENGRQCNCGKKGCLETYVSANGIVKTSYEFLKAENNSILKNKTNIESKDIYEAAKQGDKVAIKIFEFTADILGKSLSDYIALFSPEAIFLTGGLAKSDKFLITGIYESINKNSLKIFKDTVKIMPSELIDENAGLLGAAAMFF